MFIAEAEAAKESSFINGPECPTSVGDQQGHSSGQKSHPPGFSVPLAPINDAFEAAVAAAASETTASAAMDPNEEFLAELLGDLLGAALKLAQLLQSSLTISVACWRALSSGACSE